MPGPYFTNAFAVVIHSSSEFELHLAEELIECDFFEGGLAREELHRRIVKHRAGVVEFFARVDPVVTGGRAACGPDRQPMRPSSSAPLPVVPLQNRHRLKVCGLENRSSISTITWIPPIGTA